MTSQPFGPGATVSLTCSGTSASVQVSGSSAVRMVRVYNSGAVDVFIKSGDSTVVATTSDTPMPPGIVEILNIGTKQYIAGITASGQAKLYFTIGVGI